MFTAITSAALILAQITASPVSPDRTEYSGWTKLSGKQTGYFHTQKIDGKWWCVDPSGAVFFAIGTDHVNYNVHWCEALGYAPYAQNVRKKFNNDENAWAKSCTDRLKQWSFNALGANNSPSTRGRGLTYMAFIAMGQEYAGKDGLVEKIHWTGFPNVFNPAFKDFCEKKALDACAPAKDDAWLFGWFLDNELEWFGKNFKQTGIVDEAIKLPKDNHAKQALVDMLKAKYREVDKFNSAWGTSFKSWDEALAVVSWNEKASEQTEADRMEFVRMAADLYFKITTDAIRKADPNHMILGCRFAGNAPDIWDICGKYCDIVSLNYYGTVDLKTLKTANLVEDLIRWHKQAKKPLMITEWSFPALDAGLPSVHGAGMRVATQADKAKCFEVYQKTFFSLPFVVGSDYFMWVDEPALGIAKHFPEDSNYGLVDVNDDPWKLFTTEVKRVNAQVYDIRYGNTVELSVSKPKVSSSGVQVEVKNTGKADAPVVEIAAEIDGKSTSVFRAIPAGAKEMVKFNTQLQPGAHQVEVVADPQGKLMEVDRGDNRFSQMVLVKDKDLKDVLAVIGINASGDETRGRDAIVKIPVSQIPGLSKLGIPINQLSLSTSDGQRVFAEILDYDGSGTVSPEDELVIATYIITGPRTVYLRQDGVNNEKIELVKRHEGGLIDMPRKILHLTLNHRRGRVIDSIRLGDLQIGYFNILMNQLGGGAWWEQPDKIEKIRVWFGWNLTVFEVTAVRTMPTDTSTGPYAYRAVYRFEVLPDKRWFKAQFVSVENTDTRAWTLDHYFYYPQSAIGGNSEDDKPEVPCLTGKSIWVNRNVQACYGVYAPPESGIITYFWKDDKGGEHSDTRKPVNKVLKPGEVYKDDTAPIYVFCSSTKDDPRPWYKIEEEINNQAFYEIW